MVVSAERAGQSVLKAAQDGKEILYQKGRVSLSSLQASLAFGIPLRCLRNWQEVDNLLIIKPERNGQVEVSLQRSVNGRMRNLWQEVLESLERGRSEVSKAKGEYLEKYMELQQLASEHPLEDELTLRQLNLCGLWTMFPVATKRELSEINPGNVLRTMGIQDGIF